MIVRPLVYHPSLPNANALNSSTKAVLPIEFLDHATDDRPQIMKVETPGCIKPAYVTAQEYSTGDSVYLPSRVMNECFMMTDETADVSVAHPPGITELHLRVPDTFLESVLNPKEELEKVITSRYQVLWEGCSILFDNWDLEVVKTEPGSVVSTYHTDPEVIFVTDHRTPPTSSSFTPPAPPEIPRVVRKKRNFSTRNRAKRFAGPGRSLI